MDRKKNGTHNEINKTKQKNIETGIPMNNPNKEGIDEKTNKQYWKDDDGVWKSMWKREKIRKPSRELKNILCGDFEVDCGLPGTLFSI